MNFPDTTPFHPEWFQAVGTVKTACYQAARSFFEATRKTYPDRSLPFHIIDSRVLSAMTDAAGEVEQGLHIGSFIVPAVQGGAGTSINMNVNEIITNRALIRMGYKAGQYNFIDPIEQANIFQSTNDVIPASLKIAAMRLLNTLESAVNELRQGIEKAEKEAKAEVSEDKKAKLAELKEKAKKLAGKVEEVKEVKLKEKIQEIGRAHV